jgi:YVTN family beta-propeller protein
MGRRLQRLLASRCDGDVRIALLLCAIGFSCAAADLNPDRESVGRHEGNRFVTPVNQVVTPLGLQVDLPGLRPQAMALSPDGRLLAVSGKTSEVLVLNPVTGEIRQKLLLPAETTNSSPAAAASSNLLKPDNKGQVSFTGLIFSHSGKRLFLSNVEGSVKVFDVDKQGQIEPARSFPLPQANAPRRKPEIPAGLALSADDKKLYVCGNLSNQLLELDAVTGKLLRAFEVGEAPYDVVLVGQKAYISNWGGPRPRPGDLTGPAGRGTKVKVDGKRYIACEGSVSVINLADSASSSAAVITEIPAQLHSSALAVSPNRRYVVCANAASDNLTVIDTHTDTVAETIWAKQSPADLFGASPNALSFSRDGRTLYVANGTQNAIAVIHFSPRDRSSKLLGLIPVGWFPGALALDSRRHTLCVANVKGHPVQPRRDEARNRTGFNSHHYFGSVSLVPLPAERDLPRLSAEVFENYRRDRIAESLAPARPGQPARPVPERIGEPSTIEHVVYIIKENRTYDQVLGDLTEGNGDPSLCIFGANVTPNEHALVRQFVLLDNTYCCGILSADGHQWSTTAFATDYMEKSFCNFPRSYPDGMGEDETDALAYAPSGFIWDNALAHGVSFWDFGEFAMPKCRWADGNRKPGPGWKDFWEEFRESTGRVVIGSEPGVESIRPFSSTNYVGWDLNVPDVWRARFITNTIAQWEREGKMPRLVLICLPNDHTSGTDPGFPTPAAQAADNDVAFGEIIEALSHTSFWKSTAVFAIEDDPQGGWDHVSSYRTTAYVISPWAKCHAVISTQYNTTSLIRTMEQILGLPPMNQFDASATPMFDAFQSEPDFAPYVARQNIVALDKMNPGTKTISDATLRRDALVSAKLPLSKPDQCPDDLLNRIIWRSVKGSRVPYPAWAAAAVPDND